MALVDRVKRILLTPREAWQAIEAQQTTPVELYKEYVLPLAAIGPVATMVGALALGYRGFRPAIGTALSWAVVTYLLTLGAVYVLGLIIDALAPQFGGTSSHIQALKVAVYSSTASWVAGIFGLIPPLSWLGILGFYSLYLLYLGLPVLMKVPEEKQMGYTAMVIIAAIVLFLVIGLVAGTFVAESSG
jgi:Yip1 domain